MTRLDDDSDAKVPWELSRGHQLLALARAARVFGDEVYAGRLASIWEDWLDANPPGIGINWANPMEVAIRAVNWAWALSLLPPGTLPDSLRERIVSALGVHARHVAWNLEGTPRLRSNHYLADVLGLLVVGAVLTGRDAERWFRRGRRACEREIHRQVLPDGVGFEASTGYHGLCLEMFLIAHWVCRSREAPLSAAYDARLAAMVEASRALSSVAGLVPRFGDSDDGRILPLDDDRDATHEHLLWAAAAVARGRPAGATGWGPGRRRSTSGRAAWATAASRPAANPPGCVEFPDGGLWALEGGRTGSSSAAATSGRTATEGTPTTTSAPTSSTLDGRPVVVDPGTYAYTSDPHGSQRLPLYVGRTRRSRSKGEEINPIDPSRLFELQASRKAFTAGVGGLPRERRS